MIRPIRGEDGLYAPGEAPTFRLDEMADALVRAPFARRRTPATLRPEGGHLRFHDPGTRRKQIRDPG